MNSKKMPPYSSQSYSGRSTILLLVICFGAVLLAGALFYYFRAQPPASEAVTTDELDAAQSAAQTKLEPPVTPRGAVPTRQRTEGSIVDSTKPPVTAAAQSTETVHCPEAEEAVAQLSHLDLGNKPLTREQASEIKQNLQRLVAQGAGAVPAIHQFLQENKDLSLDEIKGGSPVGYPSLRAGLFDALAQIGGPEAQAALAGALHTTADPREVGLLAQQLEGMAPGQYREEILNSARETLAQMTESKTKTDVGPLFQVLQTYGDASVAGDLQKALPQWQYYGAMALAGLAEGQGVSALIGQAQQLGSNGTTRNTFALQMLAQVAPQYPDAANALINQAKAGQIPDAAWRRIAEALSGDQFQYIIDPAVDPAALRTTAGTKTYHIGNTDENFYSVPVTAKASDEDLNQRRALADQLIAATSNPAATAALQKAKNLLEKPGP